MVDTAQVEVKGPVEGRFGEILTPAALEFLGELQRRFNPTRRELLARRAERQKRFDGGEKPDFLPETKSVRDDASWRVAPAPDDLQDRRVEITGPTDRKMVINALNSGAKVFMADFEDANTPTWVNMVDGQVNLIDANARTIEFHQDDGRVYKLNDTVATLLVRPRGWHLEEKHVLVDGEQISGSLFDFGLYFFHNAKQLLARGSGPYYYLAKLESHLEARLWNDVFTFSEERLGVAHGSIKATVLIETILGAFEIDEILYELRDHSAGCNAGRWDYIFSVIKKFRNRDDLVLPDRGQITMTAPFMRAYTELLVKTCHKRGAHAIGGMAAFIPNRRDPEVTANALERVREDKNREANDGFDGTWVAHPDLVGVAMEIFDGVLDARANQVSKQRPDVNVAGADLIAFEKTGGSVTEAGVRNNVSVGLQYMEAWLRGTGAVAINNLMEDAATAEISRSQLWQWIRNGAKLDDGRPVTVEFVRQIVDEELAKLPASEPGRRFGEARELIETVSLADAYAEFLTLPAYDYID
ncbi:MAG TPA: malate synthase A [Dehalococcoidia bacterium]|nr:malate synthase A [Dehalococcoidia bacterium]